MSTKEDNYYSLADLLRKSRGFLKFLLKKWYIILLAILLGGAAGYFIYTGQKAKYVAECTFILEEKQSGLGGLSGLASQFGLDIGSMSGGSGMFAGDNILEILRSKSILKHVLLAPVDSSQGKIKLADLFLQEEGLRAKWTSKPDIANIRYDDVMKPEQMNVLQDSVLNIVYNTLLEKHLGVERVSKKGSIMRVRVASLSPQFSRSLVTRLVTAARSYYISVKTSIVSSNIDRLQRKADSLLALLTNKTYQVASVQLNDANPGLRTLQVPNEIASRDKTILATLYTEVVKNLEMARTTLMMQTPVLEILDVPSLSLYDNLRGKLFYIAIGAFVLTALTCIALLIKFALKNFEK